MLYASVHLHLLNYVVQTDRNSWSIPSHSTVAASNIIADTAAVGKGEIVAFCRTKRVRETGTRITYDAIMDHHHLFATDPLHILGEITNDRASRT